MQTERSTERRFEHKGFQITMEGMKTAVLTVARRLLPARAAITGMHCRRELDVWWTVRLNLH